MGGEGGGRNSSTVVKESLLESNKALEAKSDVKRPVLGQALEKKLPDQERSLKRPRLRRM